MTTYRLISFKLCPWVQRAAIVLREKGVDFEFTHIDSGNRPDWFHAISPHGKVPVLRIDDDIALFESNAISEYLDDAIEPRLHPGDAVQRAINRAWTDYVPTFAGLLGAVSTAASQEALDAGLEALKTPFARLDAALSAQGKGPFFNGDRYALVDTAYAPFLQRHLIVEELTGHDVSRGYPRLRAWAEALVDRPTTHSFPPEEFRALYIDILRKRGSVIVRETLEG